jgi:YhcH/YjgK/YiaL family protein
MLLAHYQSTNTFADLLKSNPVWEKALAWIQANGGTAEPGEYEIDGRNIYAIVVSTDTKPPGECTFEAHQRFVDLQYCVNGGEIIFWQPAAHLTPKGPYDKEKDVILFTEPVDEPASARLKMGSDKFAIFFPQDAHAPLAADGFNKTVRKVVVKINVDLLK